MLVSSLHYESTESIQINIAIPLSTQYYCTAGYNHFLSLLAYIRFMYTRAYRVLEACPKLVLFDVSFCSEIKTVSEFEIKYPNVTFKKSFQ